MAHWTEEMFVEHADVFERTMQGRIDANRLVVVAKP